MKYCKEISIFTALYVDMAVVRWFLWMFLLMSLWRQHNSWYVVGIMHCNYDVSYVYSLSLNSLLLEFHFLPIALVLCLCASSSANVLIGHNLHPGTNNLVAVWKGRLWSEGWGGLIHLAGSLCRRRALPREGREKLSAICQSSQSVLLYSFIMEQRGDGKPWHEQLILERGGGKSQWVEACNILVIQNGAEGAFFIQLMEITKRLLFCISGRTPRAATKLIVAQPGHWNLQVTAFRIIHFCMVTRKAITSFVFLLPCVHYAATL